MWPADVERAVLAACALASPLPGRRGWALECCAFGVPDARTGEGIACAVAVDADRAPAAVHGGGWANLVLAALASAPRGSAAWLPPAQRPRPGRVAAAAGGLPRLPGLGKVDRRGLRAACLAAEREQ